LNTISRTLEGNVHPRHLILGNNAQNDDTNTQYTDVAKTGISVNLWPWKKKKEGRRKRKNGPDGLVRIVYQGGGIARLAECSVRQHLDNQVEVEVVEDENSFTGRLRVVFHSSSCWVRDTTMNDRSRGQPWYLDGTQVLPTDRGVPCPLIRVCVYGPWLQ
jgi:DNA-binding transcriptional LysR family regulator